MTNTRLRLLLWFVGLVPTLATFWLGLWAWEEFNHHFEAHAYIFGWATTVGAVIGIPCVIFGVVTIVCTAEDDDRQLKRHYEHLTGGLRRGRAMLSKRLAPPVEEEEEA
jgi:hypothetical protein